MAGRKRKASNELSRNPNTVKARQRSLRLSEQDPGRKAYENARRTMEQTIKRAYQKLEKDVIWTSLSSEQQENKRAMARDQVHTS